MLDAHPSKIHLKTRFEEDLKADSLTVVEMVLELEETFDIDIPDEDAERLLTFKDAIDYISSKLAA